MHRTVNHLIFSAFFLVLSFSSLAQRLESSLNENWKFIKLDAAAFEVKETVDQYWKTISLPHTWNAEDAFDDERGYFMGIGCYRKHWFVPASWKGKTVSLQFEGVNHTAQVYVNGKLAGQHTGGYTAFRLDVSALVNFGEDNLIAVRVSNANDLYVAPLSADFTFYGGIYRNVTYLVTEPAHFDLQNLGSDGVFLKPALSKKGWVVGVDGKISLPAGTKSAFQVRSTLLGSDQKPVATQLTNVSSKGKLDPSFSLEIAAGNTLKKWSPEKPELYSVRTELIENGKVVDEVQSNTAFYTFRMTPDKGAFINDEPIKLMGVCRHQDLAGLGNALPDAIHVADVQRIKDMGGNFLRIAHYPQAKALLDACDRLGILVWEEIPIVNEITPAKAFFESSAVQLKEMISQHRNHPSVVMWGYMNEVFLGFGKQKTDSAKNLHMKETVRLAKILDSTAHKLDPARLTTMALHNSTKYNESGVADVANVTGWNLYHGWYHDDFPDFGKFMDKEYAAHPKRIHLISEFGAGSDQRLSTLRPVIYDFSPQHQLLYHQSYLKQIIERPWISGGTMWNLVDFGSEGRKETMPHINNKGLFTMDRKPKDAYFLYQAFLRKKPMARLAVGDWDGKILVSEGKIRLTVISNQPKVFLFSGGQKFGEVEMKDAMGVFETSAPASAIHVELQGAGGLVLGHQDLVPVHPVSISDPGFTELAVNVGSYCAYQQTKTGTIWFPTQEYKPGSWGTIGGKVFKNYKRIGTQAYIDQTLDQPLFQTMMDSLSAFKADVKDGLYEVELLFAELEPNMKPTYVLYDISTNKNPNKTGFNRVFNVKVNGQMWKEKFEPAGDPGGFRAATYKVKVQAKDGKGITVDFEPVLGNPILNGIKIRKL